MISWMSWALYAWLLCGMGLAQRMMDLSDLELLPRLRREKIGYYSASGYPPWAMKTDPGSGKLIFWKLVYPNLIFRVVKAISWGKVYFFPIMLILIWLFLFSWVCTLNPNLSHHTTRQRKRISADTHALVIYLHNFPLLKQYSQNLWVFSPVLDCLVAAKCYSCGRH